MTRECRPFFKSPLAELSTFLHLLSKDWSVGCGASDANPKYSRSENQKSLENTQPISK
jgi:hypothetical protein